MHLSLRDWENALVELGRERVKFRSHAEACIIPGTSLQMIAHLMYLSATRATGLDNIRTKGGCTCYLRILSRFCAGWYIKGGKALIIALQSHA